MSRQLDLRRSFRIAWRHKVLVFVVLVLGLLAGGAIGLMKPPSLTSKALVVISQPPQTANVATQVVVAGSDPILESARHELSPTPSLRDLRLDVRVKSLTNNVLSVTAKAHTAAGAQASANAVAESYVAYIGSSASPFRQTSARMLEQATSSTGTPPAERVAISAGVGGVLGLLVGVIAALAIGRGDRTLRQRDDIANAIGVPVLASVPVGHPTDAKGWTRLLDEYEPTVVHAWRLRKALLQLDLGGDSRGGSGNGKRSITVVSLSCDPGALALGPQLAVYAASLGIPTTLVIGPQQDEHGTATLRTACSAPEQPSLRRSRKLRVLVSDRDDVDRLSDSSLTVIVAVVDAATPEMTGTIPTVLTVLGVTAGGTTAEQLARAAVSAADDRREIAGILVADPEPTDHTTGRIPVLARPTPRRTPTRLTGGESEARG